MKKLILQIILLFTVFTVTADEPSVSVAVESKSLFVYEPFNIKVDVESEVEPDKPVVPDGSGYAVSSVSTGMKPSYNRKNTTSFLVEVVASQVGVVTIAPVEVNVGGLPLKSAPLRLMVDEPHPAEGMQLTVSFSETNLYVDQAVEVEVDWHSTVPFIQYQELLLDLPVLRCKSFSVYPVPPDVPEKFRIGLPVNEQRVIAAKYQNTNGEGLRFKFIIVPQSPGIFGTEKVRLACALMRDKQNSNQYPSYFNNNFFSIPDSSSRFGRVYHIASPPQLYVSDLPGKGRTPLFCGVAGPLDIKTTVNPVEVVVGQPMMFEVELSNMVFGGQLNAIPAVALANLGQSFKITSEPVSETASLNSHRFVYALRPLRCDISYIPALALQTFDPANGCYRMVRAEPVSITVKPDDGRTVYVPAGIDGDNLLTPLKGIKANRKQSGVLMSGYDVLTFIGEKAWIFWLLAPVIWFCIRGWIGHLERRRRDPSYARATLAMRVFRKNLHDNAEKALRGYLADRFGLCAGAITSESCVRELERHKLPSELVMSARECFDLMDSAKYSPAGQGGINPDKVAKLVKAIENGTKILLVLLLAVPFAAGAASPDDSFKKAMEMRAEKPDEARPVFIEAALGYEREKRFFNAGNSWFFAGESGCALAAYLAAESREPFRREIRESIAFLRAQRSDVFEPGKVTSSGVVRLWHQICRWDWRFRLGVLTLLYIAAWYIYILHRVFGWTPGRRICIAYSLFMAFIALTLLYSSFLPARGVVVQNADARLGPGYAYGSAYENVLPPATELDWLGTERDWVHVRLPDGAENWLHESACVRVP